MKKLILKIIILLVTLGVFYEGYGMIKELNSSNKVLEDVREVDLKNNNSIAIMVQDANTDEWHEQEDRSKWPDPSTHGFVGAECTDSDGATLEWGNVLTFSLTNQTATIKTKQTAYCTLYFAKGNPALDWLKKKGGDTFAGGGEHNTVVDGMYRFVGTKDTVTNNYICFGTVSESECTAQADKYMYRIIGITSEADATIGLTANQLKIIKATQSTSMKWHSSTSGNTVWDKSSVKSYLNSTFLSTIKNGTDGEHWENMISAHKWYVKFQDSVSGVEPKDSQYVSAESKIGLMYMTDYYNAGSQNTSNWLLNSSEALYGYCQMYQYEWTLTRTNSSNELDKAWAINCFGSLGASDFSGSYMVRPVFYLRLGINLVGEGSKEHPYLIATMNNA